MSEHSFHTRLLHFLEWFLIILVGVITLDVIWQVTSRYILQSPSGFTDELAGFLLMWLGLYGAAYVSGRDEHVAIDLISSKLSPRKRKNVFISVKSLVGLFALLVMIIGGTNLVYLSFLLEQKSVSLQIPLGYIYSCVPVCGAIIFYFAINSIILTKKGHGVN